MQPLFAPFYFMSRIDLAGKRIGKWMVTEYTLVKNKKTYWLCICDCGNKKYVTSQYLRNGDSKSCGCLRKEVCKRIATTHGLSKIPEYRIWAKIKYRCYDKNCDKYENYGGMGVIVCDRWFNSFENFFHDVGVRPSPKHSIDRFPNTAGNYEPTNFRWATHKQQCRNRRKNVLINHNGIRLVSAEWAEKINTTTANIEYHTKRGKTIQYLISKFGLRVL